MSCLNKLSKHTLNIIGIVSSVLASIMIILVIVIPILLRRKFTKDYISKCNPSMNNTNIWATFPGELNSKLYHNFGFFNYEKKSTEENKYEINIKSNITIEEEIKYINFTKEEETNTIYYYNNRTYNKKSENDVSPIDSINFGMFETLETMTYPPIHRLGINAIYYLTKKFFIEPDLFIRELFTMDLRNKLSIEDIKNKILINIADDIIEKILDSENIKYKKYSLNSTTGFFEWIKILGSEEKIKKADWLQKLFSLNEEQIKSILLNDDCYLVKEYKNYNEMLYEQFKCKGEKKCGEEILFQQLIDSTVISSLLTDIKSYQELNSILGGEFYPFDTTPEMKNYFNDEYSKKYEEKTYSQVSVTMEQLKKFLDKENKYCLLSLENTINILHINKTESSKKDLQENKYFDDLTYDNINFLSEYFYDFLPRIFLYPSLNIQDKNINDTIDPKSYGLLSKAVSNFLPKIAEKTFDKISNIDLLPLLEKKLAFVHLKEELYNAEIDEICPMIFQEVLDDGKKVYTICSDENINLQDENSFYKYIQLYYCQEETKDQSKCDESLKEYLKKIVYITDQEISNLVSKDSVIGHTIQSYNKTMIDKYECPGECTNEYLLKIQFAKARITRDPPSPMEGAKGLKEWFPELEDNYEIINIVEKYGEKIDFEEQDAFWILDSRITQGDVYDLDNVEKFKNKILFEKEYMEGLINNDINDDIEEYSSLVKLTNFLLGIYVFDTDNKNNSLIVSYQSIDNFLQGNSEENNHWLDELRSGNYFENYIPKIKKLTKFNFGFNFDSGKMEDLDLDYIGISTKTSDYNKRRITQMNKLNALNIKKSEYDIIKDEYINIPFPLYNFQKLLDNRLFSDGFQYDHELDVIYYYDIISSRPFVFTKDPKANYKYKDKVECKKYILDKDNPNAGINEFFDINNKHPLLVQKVNKPFMINIDYKENLKKFGYNSTSDDEEVINNYICVDPVSDMVIESKLNFVYSMDSRKYGLLNKNIEKDEIYPLFLYSRNYEVEVDSYQKEFPGVTEYYENNSTFIIIGVLLIILFSSIALVAFIFLNKRNKEERNELTEPIGELENNSSENKNEGSN